MDRKLIIGGTQKAPGWEVLNIIPGPHVDHVCNAINLSQFPDNTFSALYASHVLEHFDFQKELLPVLKEWHRVLNPGGSIYISVPDLEVLAQLFLLKDQLTIQERLFVMAMIFGAHVNDYDFHFTGFDQDFLVGFMHEAGFINMRRVNSFGFFHDTSVMLFKGVPISLNMVAEKPFQSKIH
jgi:predicted SAM-dependent methyltransferase